MNQCPDCGVEIPVSARFCPGCGKPAVSLSAMPTVVDAGAPPPGRKPSSAPPTPSRPPSTSGHSSSRFAPGEMLAGRYRILGRLGRGGMGEVYRADDLTLGQSVALKFLPVAAISDERIEDGERSSLSQLERFRAEVRNARQVSHPNVCRVYDIGEVDGQPFISMEYVDGEDLASLLKRIGRLPSTKALQIARQLCAGLAAAHDKGVLHRDLKPANIMIDGEGRARITDFGLAVQGQEAGAEIAGTPTYMSPEQHAGRPATSKSDIYSLGLVLYEIFTGKKAFEATTAAELRRKHSEEPPTAPSSHAPEIDPAVERVIMRCLEKDPRARSASALAVAASLPGGDPLAAALAAGETPSPELVAAAGETGGLKPRLALACLAFIIVGVAAAWVLASKVQMTSFIPLGSPPDFLAAKAREITQQLGYTQAYADSAFGYNYRRDYFQYIKAHDLSPNRWEQLRSGDPSGIYFWYRESPAYFEPTVLFNSGEVTEDDPPRDVSGMTLIRLDPDGRLGYFESIPPQVQRPNASSPLNSAKANPVTPEWASLFTAAGLDITKFKQATPKWVPPVWSDTRFAWTGTGPGRAGVPLRVEAAAFEGKPDYFRLIWPWTQASRMVSSQTPKQRRISNVVFILLFLVVLIAAVLLARRNLKLGRGDKRGAFRLAVFILIIMMLAWGLASHLIPTSYEFGVFIMGSGWSLFFAAVTWLLYIGLEPYVRRRWPNSIISWSRILTGQFRDPLVGRDILIGVTLGVALRLTFIFNHFANGWFGKFPPQPDLGPLNFLNGTACAASQLLVGIPLYLGFSLAIFFLFFLLRLVLRREWIAGVVFVLIFVVSEALPGNYPIVDSIFAAIIYGGILFILKRFGLAPLVAFLVADVMLTSAPLTTHFSTWHAFPAYLAVAAVITLAVYSFRVSLAGQQIFSAAALDE